MNLKFRLVHGKTLHFLLCILLLTLSTTAHSEALVSEDEAVRLAIEANRELKAARFLIAEAKGALVQSRLVPNPEVEFANSSDRAFKNEGEYALSAGFRQRFPIAGRLTQAEAVARVDVALAEAEVNERERQVVGETLATFRSLAIINERLSLYAHLGTRLEELVEVTKKRFKAAEVSESDYNTQQLELERLRILQQTLTLEQRTKLNELKRVLGKSPADSLSIPGALNTRIPAQALQNINEHVLSHALNHRPDRISKLLQIDRARSEEKLAKAEAWEDWTVGFEFSRDRGVFTEPIGNKQDDFLGVSLSIPLPFWNQNEGKAMQAKAAQSRSKGELEALDATIELKIASVKNELLSLLPVIARYESELLPLAQKNVKTLRESYAAGLVSFASVIQGGQQLLSFQDQYLDSKIKFAEALTAFQIETVSYLKDEK